MYRNVGESRKHSLYSMRGFMLNLFYLYTVGMECIECVFLGRDKSVFLLFLFEILVNVFSWKTI